MADERDIPHFNKMANESKKRAANYMALKGALEPMENKKTATDWLFEQLWETPKDKLNWYAILQQAKQMEKEQIIVTFNEGALDGLQLGKQYYEQTFGK